MEYEGKGGRNDYGFDNEKPKKIYNKTFYLVCIPCNHHGDKNEIICTKCGEKMYQKSQMGRFDSCGNIKF